MAQSSEAVRSILMNFLGDDLRKFLSLEDELSLQFYERVKTLEMFEQFLKRKSHLELRPDGKEVDPELRKPLQKKFWEMLITRYVTVSQFKDFVRDRDPFPKAVKPPKGKSLRVEPVIDKIEHIVPANASPPVTSIPIVAGIPVKVKRIDLIRARATRVMNHLPAAVVPESKPIVIASTPAPIAVRVQEIQVPRDSDVTLKRLPRREIQLPPLPPSPPPPPAKITEEGAGIALARHEAAKRARLPDKARVQYDRDMELYDLMSKAERRMLVSPKPKSQVLEPVIALGMGPRSRLVFSESPKYPTAAEWSPFSTSPHSGQFLVGDEFLRVFPDPLRMCKFPYLMQAYDVIKPCGVTDAIKAIKREYKIRLCDFHYCLCLQSKGESGFLNVDTSANVVFIHKGWDAKGNEIVWALSARYISSAWRTHMDVIRADHTSALVLRPGDRVCVPA